MERRNWSRLICFHLVVPKADSWVTELLRQTLKITIYSIGALILADKINQCLLFAARFGFQSGGASPSAWRPQG